jgi:hypothetical protein
MEHWIQIVKQALFEDVGSGDVTTDCTIPQGREIEATLWAKESGIVAGLQVFAAAFRLLDADVQVTCRIQDGQAVTEGDRVAQCRNNRYFSYFCGMGEQTQHGLPLSGVKALAWKVQMPKEPWCVSAAFGPL